MIRVSHVRVLLVVWMCLLAPQAFADSPRVLTRVLFQDDETRRLRWADVLATTPPTLGPVSDVEGFPKLDAEKQHLVQMEAARGKLLVGVRDDQKGELGSGWVLIHTGVDEEPHGDHSHWIYPRAPRVEAAVIDQQQGNPAHLYCYDQVFYLANDGLNGFTRIDPAASVSKDGHAAFHAGGGGHITLAAIGNRLAFSSWIDREGDHQGRVDVTLLSPQGTRAIHASFKLPHGGIHGATAVKDKVFFAPSNGICWIQVPAGSMIDANRLMVQHLSLGHEGEKPRRTGSFAAHGKHVLCTTGAGKSATLCLADASLATVTLTSVALDMADGNRPAGLKIAQPRKGSPLAMLCHEHAAGVDAPDALTIIELDPNRDGTWTDAKAVTTLVVGAAKPSGHDGQHGLAIDADQRRLFVTNPGDGTLQVISLEEQKVVAELKLGGTPSRIVAVGGRSGH